MSKSSNRQKESNLKLRIKDFVVPLLDQLKRIEDLENLPIRRDIEGMRELVEKMKGLLESREYWDNELICCFEKIERQIDYWMENQEERLNDEWRVIMGNLKELFNKQKIEPTPHQEAGDLMQMSKTSEVSEPSNTSNSDDGSSIRLDEYINQLNPQQRDCLYSLGIFPENAKIKKRLLLHWWFGLGLVPSEKNINATTTQFVETFFSDLVEKGILQPVHIRKHNRTINWCTIKPIIHRKLISVYESRLTIDMDSKEGTLCMYRDERSNARVLLNLDQKYLNSEDITRNFLSENNSLQVVQFGKWHYTELELRNLIAETKSKDHIEVDETRFLKKLGGKVTFLSLQGISRIEELPESIGTLGDLRILDLKACHNLEKLPQKRRPKCHKIFELLAQQQKWFKNLIYLDISECYMLDHIPRWVCEISEIEVLKGFVAGSADKDNQYCRLRDLSKLKKLRKLGVKIVKHLDPEDLNGLKNLENLSVLTVIWGIKEQIRMVDAENQSMDNVHGSFRTSRQEDIVGEHKVQTISFPEKLEKLDIRNYQNAEAPELLNPEKLQNLKRLYIRGGKLRNIGNSPGWIVEILRLRYLKDLDLNWYHLSSIFTKLKCVEYERCFNLKWFPKVRSYWMTETDGPFPSASDGPNPGDGRVHLTITTNKTAPLPSHKQIMMLELTGSDATSDRLGLDLVVILDVSKDMNKYLNKLKTAMLFVIKKLSSIDRLSIVIFSNNATTVYPLCKVTKTSQKEAEIVVRNLKATDDLYTDMFDGLRMGLKIINDRSNSSGRVAGIMLLSVGDEEISDDVANIPVIGNVVVHTFYLGTGNNSKVLRDIAYHSMGGTFSYVHGLGENLTKAFSVCLAGLLTVVVQDLTLIISPIIEESTLEHVSAGRYQQSKDDADGSITVKFGDLYSKEVRKVLVELQLPAAYKECDSVVVKIHCLYKIKEVLFGDPAIVTVSRMAKVSVYQHQPPTQVTAEVNRQEIVEMIREAITLRDNRIVSTLQDQKNALQKIHEAWRLAQDDLQEHFMRDELLELNVLNDAARQYGRGHGLLSNSVLVYAYSFLTSHDRQRTATRGRDVEKNLQFGTPTMREFLKQADKFDPDTSN